MALILQNCRFLHTPKTGGSWANVALKASAGIFAETATRHVELAQCPGRGLFTIAFVRHPWSWWKSYWVFKRTHGWDFNNRLDLECMDNEFERFMLNVLETSPGHCSDVFRRFVGGEGHEICFVGAFENLVDDLVAALNLAGERFCEDKLRQTRVKNAGDYQTFPTRCSPEIRRRVMDSEREALDRFNYQADLAMDEL